MPTPKKEQKVQELTELIQSANSIILTEYRGLSMKDFTELRSRLRPEKVKYQVIKNTLFRRAAEGTPLSELVENLEGPTAAAFGLEDSVAPARLLAAFIKDKKSPLSIKSGVVDGQVYDAAQVEIIAKLPPKEQLVAQVVGSLQAPIANLAGTMQNMLGSLVWTLQSVADQKGS